MCDLKCRHCSNSDNVVNTVSSQEDDNWEKVIKYIEGIVDSVDLLGGEPLLHKNIIDIVARLKNNGNKVSLVSNGQGDIDTITKILDLGLDSLYISFEGLEKTHDFIRGSGTWEKAYKYLTSVVEYVNSKCMNTKIGINVTMNRLNQNELDRLIMITKKLDINYQFSTLLNMGNAIVNAEYLNIENKNHIKLCEMVISATKNFKKEIEFVGIPLIGKHYLNAKYGTKFRLVENR